MSLEVSAHRLHCLFTQRFQPASPCIISASSLEHLYMLLDLPKTSGDATFTTYLGNQYDAAACYVGSQSLQPIGFDGEYAVVSKEWADRSESPYPRHTMPRRRSTHSIGQRRRVQEDPLRCGQGLDRCVPRGKYLQRLRGRKRIAFYEAVMQSRRLLLRECHHSSLPESR